MGFGTLEHDLLGHLAYWVQILGPGDILGSFAGFIGLALMKLQCWTEIGISFWDPSKTPLRFDSVVRRRDTDDFETSATETVLVCVLCLVVTYHLRAAPWYIRQPST